ncbi:MAG: hypothetical protein KGL02_00305 [Acidobacteriota bacterium]|nr:hypothetical protein [Acidobacteriota bacterium]MDE3169948.1 hypothetical protein [Acidobacteriota bacterium]
MSELAYANRQFGHVASSSPKPQEHLRASDRSATPAIACGWLGNSRTRLQASKEAAMREKVEALRDVIVTLGLQIIFRAAILLQRWNY